jgi:hypothetical protein
MESYILEDINALLTLKKGDSARLNQIKKLCEANEIISISDRKYIERLVTQYIRNDEQPKLETRQRPKILTVEEPKIHTSTYVEKKVVENQLLSKVHVPESLKSEKIRSTSLELSYNKKILFGMGAIILAIVLIVVVAIMNNEIQVTEDDSEIIKSATLPGFSIEIDESSYEIADIISISGKVSSSSGTIRLSIQNENDEVVWEENVNIKKNGEFSTLLISGGFGWENSGKYVLSGEFNELSNEISFEYIAKK